MTEAALTNGSPEPLTSVYDAALLDLDGVAYLDDQPIAHAAASIEAARNRGMRMTFVTNNASRPPQAVAGQLNALGIPADVTDVVTSSMAVASLLQERLGPGSAVLVVGGQGLREAIGTAGFRVVGRADDAPAAVVQGFAREITWAHLAEASLAVRAGALWVAGNADATMPTPRGPVPGNGALVAAVAAATGRQPIVVGKPEPPLHQEAVRRSGARKPLVVGDRLDTDIEGAVRVGAHSLLVLTGVTDATAVLEAAPQRRPTYVALDLRGLLTAHPTVVASERTVTCRAWRATREASTVTMTSTGEPGEDLDALRALAVARWAGWPVGALRDDAGVLGDLGVSPALR